MSRRVAPAGWHLAAVALLPLACSSSGNSADDSMPPTWGAIEVLQASDVWVAPPKASITASGTATVTWSACDSAGNLTCSARASRHARGASNWTTPAEAPRDAATLRTFHVGSFSNGAASTNVWVAEGPIGTFAMRAADFDGSWGAPASLPATAPAYTDTHTVFATGPNSTMAVWMEQPGGLALGVSGARRTAAGWSAAWVVDSAFPYGSPYYPWLSVAVVGDEAMAVWTRVGVGDPMGSPTRVFASRLPAGSLSGTVPQSIDLPVGTSLNPRVVGTALGTYVAMWSQRDGGRDRIWASVHASGAWLANPMLVSDSSSSEAGHIDLAAEPDGGVRAVWIQTDRDDGRGYTVWTSRFDGMQWEPATAIVESTSDTERVYPRVAVDRSGRTHVVWNAHSPARQVFAIEHVTRGASDSRWSDAAIVTDLHVSPGEPALAVNATGEAVVAWLSVANPRSWVSARLLRRR